MAPPKLPLGGIIGPVTARNGELTPMLFAAGAAGTVPPCSRSPSPSPPSWSECVISTSPLERVRFIPVRGPLPKPSPSPSTWAETLGLPYGNGKCGAAGPAPVEGLDRLGEGSAERVREWCFAANTPSNASVLLLPVPVPCPCPPSCEGLRVGAALAFLVPALLPLPPVPVPAPAPSPPAAPPAPPAPPGPSPLPFPPPLPPALVLLPLPFLFFPPAERAAAALASFARCFSSSARCARRISRGEGLGERSLARSVARE